MRGGAIRALTPAGFLSVVFEMFSPLLSNFTGVSTAKELVYGHVRDTCVDRVFFTALRRRI